VSHEKYWLHGTPQMTPDEAAAHMMKCAIERSSDSTLRGELIEKTAREMFAEVMPAANGYEYKVIDTRNVGVPLVGDDSKDYDGNFARGLTEKFGKDGWLLAGVVGSTMLIFARPKR
jgi:hypothetical protein